MSKLRQEERGFKYCEKCRRWMWPRDYERHMKKGKHQQPVSYQRGTRKPNKPGLRR